MTPESLTSALKDEARRLGFALAGAAPAVATPGIDHFRHWLADGFAGGMRYMESRAEAYEHPRHVLAEASSVLMLAMVYRTAELAPAGPGQAVVARYAWGQDYHEVVRARLARLVEVHRALRPEAKVRGFVDTAPLLERQFAKLAGLGWFGKNTMLLNRRLGSWFVLAGLLSSENLCYDEPHEQSYCGSCRACLDACPTGALVEPYRLDARKCISYLTIESRGQSPPVLREAMAGRLLGCDACQEACPWNRHSPCTTEPAFRPRAGMNPVEAAELLALDEAAFRARFRGTALWRPRRAALVARAAVVLGNRPHPPAREALVKGLDDESALVRGACAWALGRYAGPDVRAALAARLMAENEASVRAELEMAISPA
jgi:epoxyqueuosine reductase